MYTTSTHLAPMFGQCRNRSQSPIRNGSIQPHLALCNVQCTVRSTLYYILYSVQFIVYNVIHTTLHTVHHSVYTVQRAVHYTEHCSLYLQSHLVNTDNNITQPHPVLTPSHRHCLYYQRVGIMFLFGPIRRYIYLP